MPLVCEADVDTWMLDRAGKTLTRTQDCRSALIQLIAFELNR